MKKNWLIALLLSFLTFAVYLIFCKKEFEVLNYFLPLANSILHGKLDVNCTLPLNELVNVAGKCYIVYPPMPALALIPFALFFASRISQVYPGIIFASAAVGIFYLVLIRLTDQAKAIWLTLLLAFGTNFFMTSMIGRSWYFAHVLAVFFLALALLLSVNKKAFWAGLFLGFAGMSRLPVFLAFPALLYLIKPNKKDYLKFFTAYLAIIILYLIYNYVRFKSFTQTGYSLIPGVLDEPWYKEGILSLSYIPRNLNAMFLQLPNFSKNFPWLIPSTYAMALWLTTPAIALLVLTLKNRLSQVMILTFILVMSLDLIHGVVGFSQFGYRFSLDGILLLIIAMIPALKSRASLSHILIALSILINFYVVLVFALGYFKP